MPTRQQPFSYQMCTIYSLPSDAAAVVGDGNRDAINLNELQRLLYSKFGN